MQHALVIRWTEIKAWYLRGFELSISNTETKACSWAERQVAVGLSSGYVRLLQSQYESKSVRTVLKIISQNLADNF